MAPAARLIICVTALSLSSYAFSVTPRSDSYSFEYAATGMGGGISSSVSYDLVAYTDDTGSAGVASSASYSIEPAVGGASEGAPPSSVSSWTLY